MLGMIAKPLLSSIPPKTTPNENAETHGFSPSSFIKKLTIEKMPCRVSGSK